MRYVLRFAKHRARPMTATPFDTVFRGPASRQLSLNIAILAALAVLAVFIFTPAAAQFASSPTFWPLMVAACSVLAFTSVGRGLATGQTQPIVRGLNSTYRRKTQPIRFWASIGWNATLGCFCLWLAVKVNEQSLDEKCYDVKNAQTPRDEIAACNQSMASLGRSSGDLAALTEARGSGYYRLGDYKNALSDYDKAIRLGSQDSSSFYNRALVYEQLGNYGRAVSDYGNATRLQKDNADAFLNRGIILLNMNKLDASIADFSRVLELRPNDTVALANRGIAYAWKDDPVRARDDFDLVRKADPSNIVLLRGEALLAMNVGDIDVALQRLTAALALDPNDRWSLVMRAKVYRQSGKYDKSRADLEKTAAVDRPGHTPDR